jgi:hypothetical protein
MVTASVTLDVAPAPVQPPAPDPRPVLPQIPEPISFPFPDDSGFDDGTTDSVMFSDAGSFDAGMEVNSFTGDLTSNAFTGGTNDDAYNPDADANLFGSGEPTNFYTDDSCVNPYTASATNDAFSSVSTDAGQDSSNSTSSSTGSIFGGGVSDWDQDSSWDDGDVNIGGVDYTPNLGAAAVMGPAASSPFDSGLGGMSIPDSPSDELVCRAVDQGTTFPESFVTDSDVKDPGLYPSDELAGTIQSEKSVLLNPWDQIFDQLQSSIMPTDASNQRSVNLGPWDQRMNELNNINMSIDSCQQTVNLSQWDEEFYALPGSDENFQSVQSDLNRRADAGEFRNDLATLEHDSGTPAWTRETAWTFPRGDYSPFPMIKSYDSGNTAANILLNGVLFSALNTVNFFGNAVLEYIGTISSDVGTAGQWMNDKGMNMEAVPGDVAFGLAEQLAVGLKNYSAVANVTAESARALVDDTRGGLGLPGTMNLVGSAGESQSGLFASTDLRARAGELLGTAIRDQQQFQSTVSVASAIDSSRAEVNLVASTVRDFDPSMLADNEFLVPYRRGHTEIQLMRYASSNGYTLTSYIYPSRPFCGNCAFWTNLAGYLPPDAMVSRGRGLVAISFESMDPADIAKILANLAYKKLY